MTIIRRPMWVWMLILGTAGTAYAAEDLFPLASKVPQDVILLVASRHNPKAEFLDKAWGEVFKAVEESGAIEELWKLATRQANAADEDEEEDEDTPHKGGKTENVAERLRKLARRVQFGDLISKEWVLAGRMKMPAPDFIVLLRAPADRAAPSYDGLKAIVEELGKQGGDNVSVASRDYQGASLTSLRVKELPITFTVGRHESIILLAMGDELLNETIDQLAGKSSKPGMTSTARFREAFRPLAPAEDSMAFFDVAGLFKGIQGIISEGEKKTKDDAQATAVIKALRSLAHDLGIIDYIASTSRTDGMRVYSDSWTKLVPDAKQRGFYSVAVTPDTIDKFDRYVPREATEFSVSTGVDFAALYKWIGTFVRTKVPEGESAWEKWDEIQGEIGFNIEKDVLSWLDSGMVSISVKSSSPTLGSEPVLMFKVKDSEKAVQKIRTAISKLGERLGSAEQPGLASTATRIAGHKDFFELRLQNPAMMMVAAQFQPVWGVSDGHLMFALNKGGLRLCLETAAGNHESVLKSPRFQKEALLPKPSDGKLVSIRFSDQSNTAEVVGTALGQVGMFGMIANFNPQFARQAGVFQAFANIAGKLVPAARKLNFFLSESSYTTFDGQGWRTRSVNNYRKPPAESEDKEDWNDEWGEKDKKEKPKKSD